LGLWFELADGMRERLSEAEVDAMCNVLWSSEEKGAVSIVGKIAYERRRPAALQEPVKISEGESQAFRHALHDTRHVN
jgi:hypothetical protein